MFGINEVTSNFSEKLTTFLSSLSSLEESDDVPEWLQLFLESFRLLISDLSQANSQLSSKIKSLDGRLSVVEGELTRGIKHIFQLRVGLSVLK